MTSVLVGILIIITNHTHACAVDTVGASHNSVNAVGRNRANVIYNPAKTATQITPTQPAKQSIAQPDAATAETAEPVDDVAPAQVAPQPEPEPDLTADITVAQQHIARLQNEIKQIDSEIARCKKAKSNWTIGTVVGGVGVVGTATGAIIQAVQINNEKKKGATESTSDADADSNNAKESK